MISALTALSTIRSAMVAADFNFAGCGAVTALPAFLTALNATYTLNSAKNVLQGTSLVALSANQFGTNYDPATALYGYNAEPAATNLLLRSTLAGGGSAPTGWTWTIGTGTSTPVSSTLGNADGCVAYSQVATAQRPFLGQSLTLGTNTVYTFSFYVESVSAGLTATAVIGASQAISGATTAWPVCEANPSGGSTGVLQTGILTFAVTTVGTSGSCEFRCGLGGNGSATGSIQFSRPQVETGSIASSRIATTGSTATRAAAKLTVPLWKNNLAYSTDPTGTGWSRTNVTLTAGQSDSSGGTTAIKVEATTTAATLLAQNTIKAPAGTVTCSVKVKAGAGSTTLQFILRNSTTATNFTTGAFTTATGAISGAGWASTADGNGYYLLTFTQSTGITVGDTLYFYVGFSGDSITAGYYFYFCAPQLQPGATATTYIPTTSTLDVTGNANIPGFSSAGFTLFADTRQVTNQAASLGLLNVSDGSTANRSQISINTSNAITTNTDNASVAQQSLATSTPTLLTRTKVGYSVTANSFLTAINGVAQTADTSGSLSNAVTVLKIGSNVTGASQPSGNLFHAQLIPRVLSQAQLNGLTTS